VKMFWECFLGHEFGSVGMLTFGSSSGGQNNYQL